jgi:NADH:ubiquinone oxidoreductase subunit 4 (subunit M)
MRPIDGVILIFVLLLSAILVVAVVSAWADADEVESKKADKRLFLICLFLPPYGWIVCLFLLANGLSFIKNPFYSLFK